MIEFTKKIEQWKHLESQQRKDFYFNELIESVIKQAENKWKKSPYSKNHYDLLISLSGYSPETTIIAFNIIKPDNILVISSEMTSSSIDIISEFIVGRDHRQVTPGKFYHVSCDPTSPLEIYGLIKEKINKIYRKKNRGNKPRALIDVTGGKKVMSAAAALAAWQLDLSICYLESKYDPALRQPIPGSEELIFLDNPITLYGEEEMQKVLAIFRSGHFAEAYNRYGDLVNRISEPTFARFMRDLSDLYCAWCSVDMKALPDVIREIKKHINDPRIKTKLSIDEINHIRKQIDFLERLSQREQPIQLLCFYLIGRHYQQLDRYDFAGLFFYRTMEGCMRAQLERMYAPFNTRKPDYNLLGENIDELRKRYIEISRIELKREYDFPAWSLGYINSAIILLALKDPLLKEAGFRERDNPISQLNSMGEIRNSSILAHGFSTIDEKDSKRLMNISERILNAYWKITVKDTSFGKDIEEMYNNLCFIRFDRFDL